MKAPLFASLVCILFVAVQSQADKEEETLGLKKAGFPLYKNVPTKDITPISKAPKPFVHPRLFFTAAELPKLRSLLLFNSSDPSSDPSKKVLGAGGYHNVKAWLLGKTWHIKKKLDGHMPIFTGPYKELLDDLLENDGVTKPGSVDLSQKALTSRYGRFVLLHATNVAENGFGFNGLYGKLSGAAFVSLISENEDPFDPKMLGKVLASTCRHHSVLWKANTPKRQNGTSFFHDSSDDIGTAYDWLYNDMSENDRSACRDLIAAMTGPERREIGTKYLTFPWMSGNWNWVGWHETIVILAASIEGEHKNSNYTRWASDCNRVQSQYFMVESSEAGLGKEGIGYHGLAMNGALPSTMIVARSQKNLFEDPATRAALHRMMLYRVYTIEPWIDDPTSLGTRTFYDSFSHGDSPRPARSRHALVLRKYFPTDPLAAWNLKVSQQHINLYDPLMSAVFATDAKLVTATSDSGSPLNITLAQVAEHSKLPLNFFCRDRGEMIVRDNWLPNATVFDFEAKQDAIGLGHVHADRNSFYLYARGRSWIIDNKHGDTENEAHQTVLIDGLGQGGGATPKGANTFPSIPGVFLEYSEGLNSGVEFVAGAGDAKHAYGFAASCRRNEIKAEGFKCVLSKLKRSDFVYKAAPYLNMPKFEGLSDKWMDENNANTVFRNPIMEFNPVLRAFRSTLFVKTRASSNNMEVSAPFAIIVDDIQKDDKPHKYEYIMNLPWSSSKYLQVWQWKHEHEQVEVDTNATKLAGSPKDKILKDLRDPHDSGPRLLVRVLRANGMKEDGFKYVETKEITLRGKNKKGMARQLIIEANTISPDFCVFLYPHDVGDSLPETKWENDGSELVVSIPGMPEQTRWKLQKSASGRTKIIPSKFSVIPGGRGKKEDVEESEPAHQDEATKTSPSPSPGTENKKDEEEMPSKQGAEVQKSPAPSPASQNAPNDDDKPPYLVAAQSGVPYVPGDGLRLTEDDEFDLCPVQQDFSVVCVLPDVKDGTERLVEFFVGDSEEPVKIEGAVPYSIAGDVDSKPHAWTTYPRERDEFAFTVRCKSSDGYEVRGRIGLDCGDGDRGKENEATTLKGKDEKSKPPGDDVVDMRKIAEAGSLAGKAGGKKEIEGVDTRRIAADPIVDREEPKDEAADDEAGKEEGMTRADKRKYTDEELEAMMALDRPEMGSYEDMMREEENALGEEGEENVLEGGDFLEAAWVELVLEEEGLVGPAADEPEIVVGADVEEDEPDCSPEEVAE